MSPHFKTIIQSISLAALLLICAALLPGCSTGLQVLDGASHACGQIHIEGYLTDTQGEVTVVKAPPEWDAEQVKAFCSGE